MKKQRHKHKNPVFLLCYGMMIQKIQSVFLFRLFFLFVNKKNTKLTKISHILKNTCGHKLQKQDLKLYNHYVSVKSVEVPRVCF